MRRFSIVAVAVGTLILAAAGSPHRPSARASAGPTPSGASWRRIEQEKNPLLRPGLPAVRICDWKERRSARRRGSTSAATTAALGLLGEREPGRRRGGRWDGRASSAPGIWSIGTGTIRARWSGRSSTVMPTRTFAPERPRLRDGLCGPPRAALQRPGLAHDEPLLEAALRQGPLQP